MKNLFDYATKELSQDAFLRWLFENHADSTVGVVANGLLEKFCNFQKDEKVQTLETIAQWCKIDISVLMTTTLGRKIALFIEDKTFSNEHSQLAVYDKHIDEVKNHEIHKVFYKTNFIENDERSRIVEANKNNKADWVIFDINDIFSFFKMYAGSQNLILSQYVAHIQKIYSAVTNTKKPESSNNTIDFLEWQAYFNHTVLPKLSENANKYICWVQKAGQYPYVNLGFKKTGYNKDIPYLEIRSRDCCGGQFTARLLCYGMPVEDIPNQKKLIEKMETSGVWDCKGIVKQKQGKENYYSKQIGIIKKECKNSDELIVLVRCCIEFYLQLLDDWE